MTQVRAGVSAPALFASAECDAPSLHKFSGDELALFLEAYARGTPEADGRVQMLEEALPIVAKKLAECSAGSLVALLRA